MKQKTGNENFVFNDKPQGFQLIDFWRWQSSDLLDNTLRGVLAEFVVAKSLGVSTDGLGSGWGGYDILFENDGKKIRIEVKASAYVQSWNPEGDISKLNFSIGKKAEWIPEKKKYSNTKTRKSDVYIFCVLTEKSKANANPLNLNQWDFYPVLTSEINKRFSDRKTATINKIVELCQDGPYDYCSLRSAVIHLIKRIETINTIVTDESKIPF